MALVIFLRGVNVGGHRTFKPSELAAQLGHLDCVNIGAAGTFVIRNRIGKTTLRAELARRLPFDAGVAICDGRDVTNLTSSAPARGKLPPGAVRFVSVLPRAPRATPSLPLRLPPRGRWLVKILAREGRFIVGVYRRDMKTIGHLGSIDRIFGVPVITRNWNTMMAIERILAGDPRESR